MNGIRFLSTFVLVFVVFLVVVGRVVIIAGCVVAVAGCVVVCVLETGVYDDLSLHIHFSNIKKHNMHNEAPKETWNHFFFQNIYKKIYLKLI